MVQNSGSCPIPQCGRHFNAIFPFRCDHQQHFLCCILKTNDQQPHIKYLSESYVQNQWTKKNDPGVATKISILGHPNIRSSTCRQIIGYGIRPEDDHLQTWRYQSHAITNFASCEHLRTLGQKKLAYGVKTPLSFCSQPNNWDVFIIVHPLHSKWYL